MLILFKFSLYKLAKVLKIVFSSGVVNLLTPKGTKSLYQSANGWNTFKTIMEIGEIEQVFEVEGIKYKIILPCQIKHKIIPICQINYKIIIPI